MSLYTPLIGDVGAAASEVARRVIASVVEVRSRRWGGGAGTIWRPDGIIVTNHHVLRRDEGEVTLADGRTLAASVVARDERNDLAVARVQARDLPAATIGDARQLRPGELVLAVGHPFGVRSALTIGVVSSAPPGRGRRREGWGRELVYADVLLGPGNSGGPLADARGRVVGINAMVAGGMALAVPSHLVERLVGGGRGPAVLGIAVQPVQVPPHLFPPSLAAPAGAASGDSGNGVIVLEVAPGSAAERAGLLLGDVLLALDGRPIEGTDGLLGALEDYAGGAIRVTLLRGGRAREVSVVPAAPPARGRPAPSAPTERAA